MAHELVDLGSSKYRYREFTIYPSLVSYMKKTDWTWLHMDYDGEGDSRHGQAGSVAECVEAIDEWYEDNA